MLPLVHSTLSPCKLIDTNSTLAYERNNNNKLTTSVLQPFVRDYPCEPVPEETFTHPPSWSSPNLYQLLPSTTIHSILPVQIACLAIFLHNLCPCRLLWFTSCSGALHLIFHTFLHPISVFFSQHMPIPLQRKFCCSINMISYIPSLSLNSLLGTLSFVLTLHIYLTILISARWSATSFSFLTGQVSLPCSILLHTQLLYSLPLLITDISLLKIFIH